MSGRSRSRGTIDADPTAPPHATAQALQQESLLNSILKTDLALAPVAGYVGTKLMEPVGAKLYELGRTGPPARGRGPSRAAVRDRRPQGRRPGRLTLTDEQHERLALVFHYGLAMQWAPLYPLLRRKAGLGPVAAGLATGAAMSVVADECFRHQFQADHRQNDPGRKVQRQTQPPR